MAPRTTVWLGWMLLALAGCERNAPPALEPQSPAVPVAPAKDPEAIKVPAPPATVDEAQVAEAQHAQRLSDARVYLDQARAAAQERHRLATLACETGGQGDHESCLAAADENLQNELQAARAEFEAQMRQP